MSTKAKGGLGRGLAALIPTGPATTTVTDVLLNQGPQAAGQKGGDNGQIGRPSAIEVGPFTQDGAGSDGAAATPRDSDPAGPGTSTSIQQHEAAPSGPRYLDIPVDAVRPNSRNPRASFDEDAMAELEHSIRAFGLLQPIVVRPAADGYELVMGERRWRAAERAGLTHLPAIVRRTEDAAMLRDALLENIHRADLNPLEEAAAYQQLLDEFDVTHEELATRLGRSRPVISNTIRLLKLPVVVQRRVAAGVLSAGHARALLALEDPGDQEDLAARVVAEGLSVRGTEEAVVLMSGRPKRRRPATRRPADSGVDDLVEVLADTFDTRVRIEVGRHKGRIIVDFATVDDLHRICALMAPVPAPRRAELRDANGEDATDPGRAAFVA